MLERAAQSVSADRVGALVEQPLQPLRVNFAVQAEVADAGAHPAARFFPGGEVVVLPSLGDLSLEIAPAARCHFRQAEHRNLPPAFPHHTGARVSCYWAWLPQSLRL